MKKHLIIGISTVIILIATICAVTFAAWDITTASIEIGVIKTPDNVQLKVTTTAPESNKKLVPASAAKNSNEAVCVNIGTFKLNLSSVGGASEADLAKKAKMNWSTMDISTTVVGVTDITARVDVMVLVADPNGVDYTINNEVGKYKLINSTDDIVTNTSYIVAIKFKDNYAGDGNDAMIGNKDIKVVINFNCVAR